MKENHSIKIGNRFVGPEYPPYIVAELSANHNGNLKKAKEIIKAVADTGADAIKLQTYKPDTLTIDSNDEKFIIKGGPWNGYNLYNLYKEAHTPWEWHEELFALGHELNLHVFSTPFDETAVDFLLNLKSFKIPVFKIASFEINHINLIRYAAQKSETLIVSTGMASCMEIRRVVEAVGNMKNKNLILLHCVSSYPTPFEKMNLRRIERLQKETSCPIGLSDHSVGINASLASVALGACIIEKHVTLRRSDGGVDAGFSLEPHELKKLVEDSRSVWSSLGNGEDEEECENYFLRRSIYAVRDIEAGEILTLDNVRVLRPNIGVCPSLYDCIIGRRVAKKIKKGEGVIFDTLLENS